MFGRVHKTFHLAGTGTADVPYICKGRVKTVLVLRGNDFFDFHKYPETQGTKETLGLRGLENEKTVCSEKHFAAIGIDYLVATGINDARW
jgi:hypothetical protein